MHGRTATPRDATLFRRCGWVGLIGCAGVSLGNLLGILIYERHDWVADTISDLAAGRWGWIQDAGLVLFAFALAACGLGLHRWRLAPGRWRLTVIAALALLTVDVLLIALHNEYGDRDSGKFVIHSYLSYALGALVAVAMLAATRPLAAAGRNWRTFSLACGVVWVLAAPVLFLVPTGWDGLYERALGLLLVAWVAGLSWLLIQRGRGLL